MLLCATHKQLMSYLLKKGVSAKRHAIIRNVTKYLKLESGGIPANTKEWGELARQMAFARSGVGVELTSRR